MPILDIFTFFTKADGETVELYDSPPEEWVRVILFNETLNSKPAVGVKDNISPPLSGKGRLLPIQQEVVVTMPPSKKLYIASDSVCRIAVQIESIPWDKEILEAIFMSRGAGPKPNPQTPIGRFAFPTDASEEGAPYGLGRGRVPNKGTQPNPKKY